MVGIYANNSKDLCLSLAKELKKELEKRRVECQILERNFTEDPSLIVVVGGDGTVLDVIEKASGHGTPVLALNAGGVGFLSCFEKDEIVQCADFISNGIFEFEERPLIMCKYGEKEYLALNDVNLQRPSKGENGCTVSLSLSIDGEFADGFRADGIIIASPTGSTAYSLSAGGAILAPKLSAFIATPICAHTLRAKPIVFSDVSTAEVSLNSDLAEFFCDGKFKGELKRGQKIVVTKSTKKIKFIKGKDGFYSKLNKKLTFWSGN